MQKKSRNSRGKTRAMETHFYTMEFWFLSQEFSYEHSERFLTLYLSICRFSTVSETSTIRAHSTISETCPLIVRNHHFEQLAHANFFSHFRGKFFDFVFSVIFDHFFGNVAFFYLVPLFYRVAFFTLVFAFFTWMFVFFTLVLAFFYLCVRFFLP